MVEIKTAEDKQTRDKLLRKGKLLKQRTDKSFNSDFGMIASLGGVIITPILLGIWAGGYLDVSFPQTFSWRLILLFIGIIWGIFNAYLWIKNEEKKISRINQNKDKEIK